MKKRLLMVLISFLFCFPAFSTDRYALKERLNCNACHYNPSGGGALNIKGRYYEREGYSLKGFPTYLASLKKTLKKRKGSGAATDVISTALERLSLQGQIRSQFKQTVDRRPEVQGENFDLLDATLSFGLEVHEKLNIVYSTELNNLHSGDVFITGQGPWGTYLQVGRFTTPFGLTTDDPLMMIRSLYGLQYYLKDLGATLGYGQNGFFTNVSIMNGFRSFSTAFEGVDGIGDPFRGLAYVGNIGFHFPSFLLGASGMVETIENKGTEGHNTEALAAVYMSVSYKRLHLSGEADFGFKKGIGTGTRLGLESDKSPAPVKTAQSSYVEPFNGKLSPNFGDESFGAFAKLTYDLAPNKWDISAQLDILTGNMNFLGDAPYRISGASKFWVWDNFYVEPQYHWNVTPGGLPKNAGTEQLQQARRRNKNMVIVYAKAVF